MKRTITLGIETSECGRYCSPDCRPKDWNLCWACGVHAPLQFAEGTDRASGLATFVRHPACLAAESRTYEDGVRAALETDEDESDLPWSVLYDGRRTLIWAVDKIQALLPEAER